MGKNRRGVGRTQMSHRESQQRYVLFWLSAGYITLSRFYLDEAQRNIPPESDLNATQLALAKTASLVHRLAWFLSVLHLCSLEFGNLYCGGETIVSYYLRKFARFLTNKEKYKLASNILSFAVSWNELWLGSRSLAVQPGYRHAAVLNSLAGK